MDPLKEFVWSRAPPRRGHLHAQHREGRCSRELGASRAAHAVVVDGWTASAHTRTPAPEGPCAVLPLLHTTQKQRITDVQGSPGKRRVIGTLAYVPRAQTLINSQKHPHSALLLSHIILDAGQILLLWTGHHERPPVLSEGSGRVRPR